MCFLLMHMPIMRQKAQYVHPIERAGGVAVGVRIVV